MKEKIKPVIMIDFGGTYFTTANKAIAKKFSKKLGLPEEKIRGAMMGTNWTEHATGKWDEKKYWKNVSDELNISRLQTQELRKALYSYSKPQNGMAQLVRKLKRKYTVAALSSITSGWVEALEKKYRISRRFHYHHYTYDHGIDKPDSGFFLSAARKMKARPENCIVVDDSRKFLAAVRKTGARTILFRNAKQLETDLRKVGVEI